MTTPVFKREVAEIVDGGGLYFSRMVTSGPLAFLGGVAADGGSGLADSAIVPPPYGVSPDAQIASQTRYLFEHYKTSLASVGSTLNNMLQVEQYIPRKSHADGYLVMSRADGFMDADRPASALICTGDLLPADAVITAMGIAVVPGQQGADGNEVTKQIARPTEGYHDSLSQYGETYRTEGPFNEVLTAGPYVFVVGDVTFDFETKQIEPDVRVGGEIWWGSAIRNELDFLLTRLETYLERVGGSLADVVHSSVYLANIEDLYEFDLVWKRRFGSNLPARTLFPVRGLSVPLREGVAMSHPDGAIRMEMMVVALRPGHGAEKQVISSRAPTAFPESQAIKAGQLMWVSGLYPINPDGSVAAADAKGQVDHLFSHLVDTCKAGGGDIRDLVRLRAFVTNPEDGYLVYAALKKAVPNDPPTVAITSVPGPLPYPDAHVMIDAVVHVSDA